MLKEKYCLDFVLGFFIIGELLSVFFFFFFFFFLFFFIHLFLLVRYWVGNLMFTSVNYTIEIMLYLPLLQVAQCKAFSY